MDDEAKEILSRSLVHQSLVHRIERLRAELAAERRKHTETALALCHVAAERDTLRNLLWEAREQLWLHGPDTLCARIDAALIKGGGDEG